MSKLKKILVTICVVGVVGVAAGFSTFAAFSSTTTNPANTFATGSVTVGDNDAGSAMYTVSNAAPSSVTTKCIKVTYSGSLPATVKLYTASTFGASAGYVDLSIDKGTGNPTFPGCTGFSSTGNIYTGTLGAFAAAHGTYANGVAAFPGSQTEWDQNDVVVYRFTLTVQSTNSAQGQTIASHDFTWEAQSQ